MNNYFEDKLRLLDERRLEELAVMSTTDVEDILGAQVALPDTSEEELETTDSRSNGGKLRERVSGRQKRLLQ